MLGPEDAPDDKPARRVCRAEGCLQGNVEPMIMYMQPQNSMRVCLFVVVVVSNYKILMEARLGSHPAITYNCNCTTKYLKSLPQRLESMSGLKGDILGGPQIL